MSRIALVAVLWIVTVVLAQTPTLTVTPSASPFPSTSSSFQNTVTPTPSPILFTPSHSPTPSHAYASATPAKPGRTIEIDFANLLPQGIAWSTRNGFLVGSLNFGTIYSIGYDGSSSAIYQSANTQHTSGLRIDYNLNRVLVANTAAYPAQTNVGNILSFDMISGAQIFQGFVTNVGGALPVFVNQVAIDSASNAYATDSYSGRIFQVSPVGHVSLFFSHPLFLPQNGNAWGLTGIECIEDYLIAVVYGAAGTAKMYKLPLNNPSSFTLVDFQDQTDLAYAFGLTWDPDNEFLNLVTTDGHLRQIQSNDDFDSAEFVGDQVVAYDFPTAVTLEAGVPFVITNANYTSGPYYIEEINYDINSGAALLPAVSVLMIWLVLLAVL